MLTRQVVLDARGRIFAYELVHAGAARDEDSLLHAVSHADAGLAQRRTLFVRCSPATIVAGHLDLVDPEQVIVRLELPAAVDGEEARMVREALPLLVARGMRLCLDQRAFR